MKRDSYSSAAMKRWAARVRIAVRQQRLEKELELERKTMTSSWLREEFERTKTQNMARPPRHVVTNPIFSAHSKTRPGSDS